MEKCCQVVAEERESHIFLLALLLTFRPLFDPFCVRFLKLSAKTFRRLFIRSHSFRPVEFSFYRDVLFVAVNVCVNFATLVSLLYIKVHGFFLFECMFVRV